MISPEEHRRLSTERSDRYRGLSLDERERAVTRDWDESAARAFERSHEKECKVSVKNLKAVRRALKMTERKVAHELDVPYRTYRRYEKEKKMHKSVAERLVSLVAEKKRESRERMKNAGMDV